MCLNAMPRTNFLGAHGTIAERLFYGQLPVVHANAHLYYHAMTESCRVFFAFKYNNYPEVAVHFGRIMAEEIVDTDFFNDIDLIIPIPLHPLKERQRGYNQSEKLAEGVAAVTGIAINTSAVVRVKNTLSQTGLTPAQRRENVHNAFALRHPEEVANRHVLIIDDVMTTNATIRSCAETIEAAGGVRFSILTLGIAGSHTLVGYPYVPCQEDESSADFLV